MEPLVCPVSRCSFRTYGWWWWLLKLVIVIVDVQGPRGAVIYLWTMMAISGLPFGCWKMREGLRIVEFDDNMPSTLSISWYYSQQTHHSLPVRVRYRCLLWVQSSIYFVHLQWLSYVQYCVIIEDAVTGLGCNCSTWRGIQETSMVRLGGFPIIVRSWRRMLNLMVHWLRNRGNRNDTWWELLKIWLLFGYLGNHSNKSIK